MKHIALDYHFVREQVQAKTLCVAHICSISQLADALTKPLSRALFLDLSSKIGFVLPSILNGHVSIDIIYLELVIILYICDCICYGHNKSNKRLYKYITPTMKESLT